MMRRSQAGKGSEPGFSPGWIKICGLTSAEAVAAALDAGVDALGFVFAPSVRRIAPSLAARLAAPARGRAACVAVMRRPTQQELDEVLGEFRPDALQIDADDLARLRVPASLELLPVLRTGGVMPEPLPPRLLYEGAVSGSGTLSDWTEARGIAGRARLVLAGGLTALNVAAAIREVRPFGVDVSSGVEARPGEKSAAEIARFTAAARAAFGAPRAAPVTFHEESGS